MSHRWPGWQELPGVEIAPMAEAARAKGGPHLVWSYCWAHHQGYVTTFGYQVDADGSVSMPWDANWEPVTGDGMLLGFRKIGTEEITEKFIRISVIEMPEGEPPWSPALAVRLPAEQIGARRAPDSLAEIMDTEGEPCASIAVCIVGDDGAATQVVWGITAESAASLIAVIREKHGEPLAEAVTGDVAAMRDAMMAVMNVHAIHTMSDEES